MARAMMQYIKHAKLPLWLVASSPTVLVGAMFAWTVTVFVKVDALQILRITLTAKHGQLLPVPSVMSVTERHQIVILTHQLPTVIFYKDLCASNAPIVVLFWAQTENPAKPLFQVFRSVKLIQQMVFVPNATRPSLYRQIKHNAGKKSATAQNYPPTTFVLSVTDSNTLFVYIPTILTHVWRWTLLVHTATSRWTVTVVKPVKPTRASPPLPMPIQSFVLKPVI